MTPSQQDALAALKDIEHAAGRAIQARCYARESPHFIVWGLVWLVCYGLSDLFHDGRANTAWLIGTFLGIAASCAIGMSQRRPKGDWRYFAIFPMMVVFVSCSFLLLPPPNPEASSAFISLVVALCYVFTGLWSGPRVVLAGLILAALTLGGYFAIHAHFFLYMAVIGGGALILAGLWLRRI